jgi:hypothetical protein
MNVQAEHSHEPDLAPGAAFAGGALLMPAVELARAAVPAVSVMPGGFCCTTPAVVLYSGRTCLAEG